MSTRRLAALLCMLLIWMNAPAQADPVASLDRMPLDGLHTYDRVDLNWSLGLSDADSVTLGFGDGQNITVDAAVTTARHFYNSPGRYGISFTVWVDGQAHRDVEDDFIQVEPRDVPGTNVMYLHHSTGRYMVRDSGFRSLVDWHNENSGSDIRFWDHDYAYGNSYTGVILPDSTVHHDWIYGYEANDITPAGYHDIFVNAPAFRDSLFNRHEVLICKNDHSTGDIESDAQLAEYKEHYLAIRDVLDQYPDKLFILMSGPSRRPEKTDPETAGRAREFYNWLQSPEFMNGHPNLAFFDLFDHLAYPDDDGNPEANMTRAEYRLPEPWDDHPNELANVTIGPLFADMVLRTLDPDFFNPTSAAPTLPAAGLELYPAVPNPFNPATVIAWELDEPALVRLQVYDVSGRLVRTLVDGLLQTAGRQEVLWRGLDDAGRPQPSGVYFYRLEAGGSSATQRMTLVR